MIDSSSLIYAQQAGFFQPMAGTIALLTVPGVALEVGETFPDIEIVGNQEGGEAAGVDLSAPVDRQVVAAGVRLGIAVISDDKKLLGAAAAAGCDYYNALLILEMLLLRQVISFKEHAAFQAKLTNLARYSGDVLNYAETLHWAVRKRIG